ncbi:MAG TPA: CARDB domain-containing protein, partial [Flavobacteriaceae bacterium]|nr:CARDB domain-containing protein [Flavobacteriaceae bacterium]
MKNYFFFFSFFCFFWTCFGQQIDLYTQFNGRYDYVAIGNTLNTFENDGDSSTPCEITTGSAATLSMQPGQTIIAAYLYWAGSGSGDFNVKLNDVPIKANRTFNLLDQQQFFFAAFADVTSLVISEGNTHYTLSQLDLTSVIPAYCQEGGNFAGWSIIVIYQDPSLPMNQIGVYDGLESVSAENFSLNITLNNINVIDDQGAKIGFLAWEGDAGISVQETLKINGNLISNPPLNPSDNAFNGTNSFTGNTFLYNMDIDYYNIENNIQIGDTSVDISLTSGQDFVMINNIITVLNSQLPDASPSIDLVQNQCGSREIEVDYTISNFNSTDFLPANTDIYFYADAVLVGASATQNDIPIGGTETGNIILNIPANIPKTFNLSIVVDDNNIVAEINETNNSDVEQVYLLAPEIAKPLEDLYFCDENPSDETGLFDLTINTPLAIGNQTDVSASYHLSQNDADLGTAEISTPQNYQNTSNPQEIFIRVEENSDPTCYVTDSFFLYVVPTPLAVDPEPIRICDDPSNDGTAVFDLTELSATINNGQSNTHLSFHTSQADAETGANAIGNPSEYENVSNPQTIYVRLESTILASCYSIISFELLVGEIAPTISLGKLHNCDEGFDRAFFDLTSLETQIPTPEIIGYFRSE